ncbi:superantigen-like protein [Staphylococcus hyicus]|uniref:exotoxin beta-grasp domain-containing protein n=1 Tax=Staphylococcus hyicus TaxID=1284 RepID=UPI00217DEDFE|nr:superantigen-like protein [Staphylococcus hyicus]UWF56905.1 superantigen-like protein [Staphylococcus hyicus]
MKLSTIAKTSLALGILTTGVMTTYAQSADAEVKSEVKNQSQDVQKLYDYYTKNGFDYIDQTGYKFGDKVEVIDKPSGQFSEVKLAGKDKDKFNKDLLPNIDVFVVREDSSKGTENHSIGGITKTNSKNYDDYVVQVPISIERHSNGFKFTNDLTPYQIKKEEISLKELDFKLRKKLIDEQGLYKNNNKNGSIVIKMKSDDPKDVYSFELDKKLQDHRMGDVIDSRKIEKITVSL